MRAEAASISPSVIVASDGCKTTVIASDLRPSPRAPPVHSSQTRISAISASPAARAALTRLSAGTPAESLVRAARAADETLIADVRVFDEFTGGTLGEGRKSLAITVVLQPAEATMTDGEIEAVSARIVANVAAATGGVLRS